MEHATIPTITKQQKRILDAVKEKFCGLLDEQGVAIFADFKRAFEQSDSDKFSFPLTGGITITPVGEITNVKCKLRWGVSTSVDCETEISAQPDMFDPVQ